MVLHPSARQHHASDRYAAVAFASLSLSLPPLSSFPSSCHLQRISIRVIAPLPNDCGHCCTDDRFEGASCRCRGKLRLENFARKREGRRGGGGDACIVGEKLVFFLMRKVSVIGWLESFWRGSKFYLEE